MSEVVGEGVIRIRTDESGVDVDGAGKRAGAGYSRGFAGSLKGIAAGIGVALAAAGTVAFLKDSIGEAREAQKVGAATNAILKATGGAAKITAGGISDLAASLSAKTAVDDEQIQAGANLLLTFKNVKREGEGLNDVFGRATAAGLDLAAAGFGSVEGNAKQLGKALNDPLKGISALGRAGVTFTAAQQEQIKGYVESNDLLSAQKVILGEVEAQVGGTAEATATSGEKAAVAFGNVKESAGTALLPVLDALFNMFAEKIAPAILDLVTGAGKLGPVFSAIGGAISAAFSGDGATSALAGISGALASLGPVIMGAFSAALPIVQSLFSALGAAASTILPLVVNYVTLVATAFASFAGYVVSSVIPIVAQIAQVFIGQVIPVLVTLGTFIYGTVLPAIIAIVTTVAGNLKPVFDQLVATMTGTVIPAIAAAVDQFRNQLLPALLPIIEKVISLVGFLAGLAATILGVVLPPVLRFAGFLLANLIPAVVAIITKVVQFVGVLISLGSAVVSAVGKFGGFVSAIVGGVTDAVQSVVKGIGDLPGKVLDFVGRMVSAGAGLIGGLLDGMRNAAGGVGGIISGVADSVLSAVRNAVNSVIDAFNGAIPNSLGAGPLSIDLPDNPIPHLQSGTSQFGGGFAYTGEVGPEKVFLPGGARVLTAAQTRQSDAGDQGSLIAALASVLAPFLADLAARPPMTVMLPSGDPEAAAMAMLNRLATA